MSARTVTLGGLALDVNPGTADCQWVTDSLRGWQGPASSVTTVKRPRSDGAIAGTGYRMQRTVSLRGHIVAPTADLLDDALDALNAAASLTPVNLSVLDPDGSTRYAVVQRQDEVLAEKVTATYAAYSVQLLAPDPRKFTAALSATTALATTTGGLTFPMTFPYTIDATTVSGEVSLTNDGTVAGPVTMRVDGPCTGPVITHSPSGAVLSFASSFVLSTGEWLDIDMDRRTVLANGQSSRSKWLTSRGWSTFEPGGNTWSFEAATYDAGSRLTVTATPAWE